MYNCGVTAFKLRMIMNGEDVNHKWFNEKEIEILNLIFDNALSFATKGLNSLEIFITNYKYDNIDIDSIKKELFIRGFDVKVIEDLYYNTGVIKLLVKW